jgi:hypothetical protein
MADFATNSLVNGGLDCYTHASLGIFVPKLSIAGLLKPGNSLNLLSRIDKEPSLGVFTPAKRWPELMGRNAICTSLLSSLRQ